MMPKIAKQQTISGCEVDKALPEERLKQLDQEMANLDRKKLAVEDVLNDLKVEEKKLRKEKLALMHELEMPILRLMREALEKEESEQ